MDFIDKLIDVKIALGKIPERERIAVMAHLGLGCPASTLAEVGDHFGVCTQMAATLYHRGIEQLEYHLGLRRQFRVTH